VSANQVDAAPPGQALRAAREARKLSVAKAADELRLSHDQVAAMEEGRYDSLGPAVFARGHLRRYAVLLGLPEGGILEAYEAAHRDDASPTLLPAASLHTPVVERKSPLARALAVLVPAALAAIVAGAWWLQGRDEAPASAPATFGEAEAPGDTGATSLVPGQAVGRAAEVGEAAPAASDSDRLAFDFTDPCWVEVYDATGQRLAFELAARGASLAFSGPAPWRVVLGNVRAARLAVDGRKVTLPGNVVMQNTASIYVDEAGTIARVPAASQDES